MRNSREQILTILAQHKLWLTPSNIAYNTELSRPYIQRECQSLWDKELLDREANNSRPFYFIRERGQLALVQDSLDIEYSYCGYIDGADAVILVQPAGKILSDYGDDYYRQYNITWGPDGGSGGKYNLAEDLLRHAAGDDAVAKYSFDFYEEVTVHLKNDFVLTESQIHDWVDMKREGIEASSEALLPTKTPSRNRMPVERIIAAHRRQPVLDHLLSKKLNKTDTC